MRDASHPAMKRALLVLATSAALALGNAAAGAGLQNITLKASAPAIFRGRANVTVSWLINASDLNFWVGVYSPANYSLYLRYANVTTATGSWTTELLAAREPFVFRLYRRSGGGGGGGRGAGADIDTLVAVSNAVAPDPLWPMQLRAPPSLWDLRPATFWTLVPTGALYTTM